MRFADNFLEALGSLWTNKMRSILTMLGIIIGITAVIAIMTIGTSMQAYLEDTLSGFGINNVTVTLQSKNAQGPVFRMIGGSGRFSMFSDKDLITDEMLDGLKAQYPDEIKALSISEGVGEGQTEKGEDYANLSLSGVNPEYQLANSLTMLRGRFIADDDNAARRRLAVVSDKLVSNMFGDENPLGKELVIQTQDHIDIYTVVGVYEYGDGGLGALMGVSTSSDYDMSTDVYIPLSVAQKVNNSHGYSTFTVLTQTGVNSTDFGKKIEGFFGRYYSRNDVFGVSAFSMESFVEEATSMLN
ncbi:MAG: ABC transporter permease, partial [Clostridiales bacterium]|nr:ABC transporter permease [Clostridiales bacterium]